MEALSRPLILGAVLVAIALGAPALATDPIPAPTGESRHTPWEAFEPTIGVDNDGTIFMNADDNRLSSTSDVDLTQVKYIVRSDDQGHTWTDITPRVGPTFALPPQTLDPFLYVDTDTGRVLLPTSYASCMWMSISDDKGATWLHNPIGCGIPLGLHDHQSVYSGPAKNRPDLVYPNIFYYCVNRVTDSACATSLDGGLTWGPMIATHSGCGLTAHVAVAPNGNAYVPFGCSGIPQVSVTNDDGLTWHTYPISTTAAQGHEVAIAVDDANNVYAFWISTNRLPYLAVSTNGGVTWGPAIMVAPAGVGTTDFPTVTAGADGRVAFAYYGTAATKTYASMTRTDTWNEYIGYSTDATSATPTINTVSTNPASDPLARGVCGGSRCPGGVNQTVYSRGVGDFIDIVIDSEGRPWAAGVDVCNSACITSTTARNWEVYGVVGTLATGPRLRGPLEALPPLS